MSADARGVAVIGAGDMGARHAAHWAATGARIVAIFDPDASRALALARRHGAVACTREADAVGATGVDVVSVCTPTHQHADVTVLALEAGRDVLCEKPVALTVADADRMASAERASGRRLRIGFMRRFDPLWSRVDAFRRALGGPLMAQATVVAGVRPKRLMHDARVNGGPVVDMACHLFDRWERLFGDAPETVSAIGHTFGMHHPELRGIEEKALDSVQVTLAYRDGGVGQMQISWGLPAGVPPVERHTYVGPGGLVDVDERTCTLIDGGGPLRWGPGDVDPWAAQIRAYARELDGEGPQGLADVEDGIRALRLSLAVLTSVREGRPVRPEEADPSPMGVA